MKVLITGACGFIGTNLCLSLLNDGIPVIGMDSLTSNYSVDIKKRNLMDLSNYDKFQFETSDILSSNLKNLLRDVDVIYHLAGQPSVHNSWGSDFETYSKRNILLTHFLLMNARNSSVRKFIYSSSSSIYGRVKTTPTVEEDPKNPISPYGVTKFAAENLVSLYGSEFGLNTVSLRYFTVYGPRQRPDMAFHKLIQAGRSKLTFPLHGDGTQIRDFTFVSDVVDANKRAANQNTTPGAVFNVGGGSPVSMLDAIGMIEEIMDVNISIDRLPLGPGNPMITKADCSAAQQILGWTPKVKIFEGLQAQVNYQKEFFL